MRTISYSVVVLVAGTSLIGAHASSFAIRPVAEVGVPVIGSMWVQAYGARVAFSDDPNQMFISEGTPGSTHRISTHSSGAAALIGGAAELSGRLLFVVASDQTIELVSTDGTEQGTRVIYSQSGSWRDSSIDSVHRAGDLVYFVVPEVGRVRYQLWRSDGTSNGTVPLWSFSRSRGLIEMFDLGGVFYMTAGRPRDSQTDPSESAILVRSDGTSAGTTELSLVQPGFIVDRAIESGDRLCWASEDVQAAFWLFDPQAGMTRVQGGPFGSLRAIVAGPQAGSFVLSTGAPTQTNLWLVRSDGTSADLIYQAAHPNYFHAGGRSLTASGKLFFWNYPAGETELWTTDGSSAGTYPVHRARPNIDENFGQPIAARSRAFYFANDGIHGRELWTSDGTEAGTRIASDFRPGVLSGAHSNFFQILPVRSRVYVQASSGVQGENFWRLDLCPADFDNSGDIEIGDLFGFLAAYLGATDRADVDATGSLTTADVFVFLESYFAGCTD